MLAYANRSIDLGLIANGEMGHLHRGPAQLLVAFFVSQPLFVYH